MRLAGMPEQFEWSPPREVGAGDRLALTVCLSLLLHAMLVLGVGFSSEPKPLASLSSLEVILVNQFSEQAPKDAKLLAQRSLEGGGDEDVPERPAAPLTAPFPDPEPNVTAVPVPQLEARAPQRAAEDAPDREASNDMPHDAADDKAHEDPVLASERADPEWLRPQSDTRPGSENPVQDARPQQPQPEVAERPLPSAAQLLTSSFALASLNAELQQKLQARAERPRHRYISASTQEYRYAAYMDAWRAKVERIGNLNYPDEARRRGISGSLVLDVALNQDGSIREISIRRPSGHDFLDQAAIRIVELAGPYAPLPPDIAREVDVLHITRTWQFRNEGSFGSR
ncbi:MAG: TonB family protein [Gammaproteobacteria bacterium]|nr:TonB family protein [Gammaproteobacteria bacterium]